MSVKVKNNDKPKKKDVAHAQDTSTTEWRTKHPLLALREEVDHLFDNFFSGFALGPFGEFRNHSMQTEPFRRFEDAFSGLGASLGKNNIKSDVRETDDTYFIEAELPGFEEGDIDVSVADNLLTISGERKTERKEDQDDYHLTERHYGAVKRKFPIPEVVDLGKAEAKFKNGVLSIALPKKALFKPKAKKIPIATD